MEAVSTKRPILRSARQVSSLVHGHVKGSCTVWVMRRKCYWGQEKRVDFIKMDERSAGQCWRPTHCGGHEEMTPSLDSRVTFTTTEVGKMAVISVDMKSPGL